MRIRLKRKIYSEEDKDKKKHSRNWIIPLGAGTGLVGGGFAGDIGINNRVPEFYDKKKGKLLPRLTEDEFKEWKQFIKREDRRRIPFVIGGTLVGAGIGYGLKKAIEKREENRNNSSDK